MRMMMKVTIPIENGNAAVRRQPGNHYSEDPRRLKPEYAYFWKTADRTGIIFST